MTGLGLKLFAIGLVPLTTGGLVLSLSPEHLSQVRVSVLLQLGGALGTFFGLISMSIGSLLCLFIPPGNRGRVPLLCSLAMLGVLTVLRLVDFTGFMRPSTHWLRIASAVVGITWFVAWTVYIIRIAKQFNRDDLVLWVFMVLPVVALCLSMIGYRFGPDDLESTHPAVQTIRFGIFCLGCFMATVVYSLSRSLLDTDSRRPIEESRPPETHKSETSLPTSEV